MIFSKRCNTCKKQKSVKQFHRDAKNRDGYSASCGPCRNAKRKDRKLAKNIVKDLDALYLPQDASKISNKKNPSPKIQTHHTPIKTSSVPIVEESRTILDAINEKYGATFTITVQADRKCHINIMKDGWKNTKKFLTPEELLESVL